MRSSAERPVSNAQVERSSASEHVGAHDVAWTTPVLAGRAVRGSMM